MNGLARFRLEPRPGMRTFADCPVHGRVPAVKDRWTETRIVHGVRWPREKSAVLASDRYLGPDAVVFCGTCDGPASPVRIKVRGNGISEKPCGGACLNGRTSCDCRCGGLCHGAGACAGGH